MRNDEYYSVRNGKKDVKHNVSDLEELLLTIIKSYARKSYFQEYFGDSCMNNELMPGKLGNDEEINAQLQMKTGKKNLWPFHKIFYWQDENYPFLLEDDLFDLIEFFFDCISKPVTGSCHGPCGGCGSSHYENFDSKLGKDEYKKEINKLLGGYGDGYLLGKNGKIFSVVHSDLKPIYKSKLLSLETKEISRLERAKKKFLSRNLDDKRDAIKDLADILEHMKDIEKILNNKDDSDIFRLLNQFGVRHNNLQQDNGYDKEIFYPWIFNYLLVSIIAIDSMLSKK